MKKQKKKNRCVGSGLNKGVITYQARMQITERPQQLNINSDALLKLVGLL